MNDSLIKLLKKMCSYVGVKYEDIDFKQGDWFLEYQWTTGQELEFVSWLSKEIRSNSKFRNGISYLHARPNKKMADKFAQGFVFNYGWKTK